MADANSAQEVIRASLLLVGAISQDEQPSASEAQDGLNRLNDMLDMWSADRITVYSIQRSVFALGSAASYTLGPGGGWDQPYPPTQIEEAYIQVTTTQPPSEVPLYIVEAQKWAEITVKTTTSSIPREMWPDYNFPLCNVNLFPIPTGINNIVLYQWSELSRSSDLTSDLVFPQGYRLGIIYNLAQVLAPFYGKPLSKDIVKLASDFKAVIGSRNLPEHLMSCDLGTLSPSKTFNWLTGEAR